MHIVATDRPSSRWATPRRIQADHPASLPAPRPAPGAALVRLPRVVHPPSRDRHPVRMRVQVHLPAPRAAQGAVPEAARGGPDLQRLPDGTRGEQPEVRTVDRPHVHRRGEASALHPLALRRRPGAVADALSRGKHGPVRSRTHRQGGGPGALDLPSDKKIILYVGRLSVEKNPLLSSSLPPPFERIETCALSWQGRALRDETVARVRKLHLDNLPLFGIVPPKEMPALTCASTSSSSPPDRGVPLTIFEALR